MNENLRKLIKRHEGLSLIPYRCPSGHLTIGWGWNYDANPLPQTIADHLKERGSITPAMADELLDLAIKRSIKECERLYPKFADFSESRRNALIDMTYNMGSMAGFRTTNRMINDGHWTEAANNLMLSKWYKQVKNRAKEDIALLRRG
jgi:lysozyme